MSDFSAFVIYVAVMFVVGSFAYSIGTTHGKQDTHKRFCSAQGGEYLDNRCIKVNTDINLP